MKFNITLIFLVFNISLFSQSEFKLSSNEDISNFKIGSNIFDLMSRFEISFGDEQMEQVTDQLKKLDKIIAYSSESKLGSSNIEDSFEAYILSSDLMQLIEFEEKNYKVDIYVLENEDSIIEELSMLVKNSNSYTTIYLQIRGEIDLEQIANVASELNVPGGDFLNKLN
ncbi:DUF4252 domain-containing protein [Flavobacteriaceae bacterium]|nr:DUF4252 domain-containing protein [Flavobacteriaceae bacterium]MDC1492308.1 DUF4252 domain-containing protein [Flavobacteriaceae bacterium]